MPETPKQRILSRVQEENDELRAEIREMKREAERKEGQYRDIAAENNRLMMKYGPVREALVILRVVFKDWDDGMLWNSTVDHRDGKERTVGQIIDGALEK